MISKDTEVSFCIPTYNNFHSVSRIVKSVLESDSADIEIVVLDNGSTDDTYDLLKKINDPRLSVYRNIENKGALFNMINVLDKGKGKYLVYCTDHDYITTSKIKEFKLFLKENNNISFGYCEYDSNDSSLFDLFKQGTIALSSLAYITRHPTGYFFNNEKLKTLNIVERFSNYEFVDLFPLEFIFAELSLLGDGAVYHDSLFRPETGERVVKHKSATTKGNSKTAFFSPECRLKLAVNFEKHINSLKIAENDKSKIAVNSFYRELNNATFGFKKVMANEKICIHYRMEQRFIGKLELLKIGYAFCKGYDQRVIKSSTSSLFATVQKRVKFYVKPHKAVGFFARVIIK